MFFFCSTTCFFTLNFCWQQHKHDSLHFTLDCQLHFMPHCSGKACSSFAPSSTQPDSTGRLPAFLFSLLTITLGRQGDMTVGPFHTVDDSDDFALFLPKPSSTMKGISGMIHLMPAGLSTLDNFHSKFDDSFSPPFFQSAEIKSTQILITRISSLSLSNFYCTHPPYYTTFSIILFYNAWPWPPKNQAQRLHYPQGWYIKTCEH